MVTGKTIVKNFSWLFISEMITNALSFIIIIIIARYLGDSGLGKYSYAFAFANLALILSEVGFNQFIVREISRNKNQTEKIFGNILTLKIILSFFALFVSCIFLIFTETSKEIIVVVIIATAATIIYYTGLIYRSLMMAYEIMEYESWTKIAERLILIIAIPFVLIIKGNLILLVLSYLMVYILISVLRFLIVTKKIGLIKPKTDFRYWKQILLISIPLYISGVFITISFRLEVVFLKKMYSFNFVGWYDAASKLVDGLSFFPAIIVMAVYPALSQLYVMRKDLFHLLFKRSFKYMYIFALPMALGVSLLGPRIISFIYGEQFIHSGIILQIIIWAEFFIFLNYLNNYLLNSMDKQKLTMICSIIGVAINIVIGFILIKNFGFIGAAATSVIVQATYFFIIYNLAKRQGYGVSIWILWKPAFASLTMAFLIILMKDIHLLIVIPSAVIVYFLTLVLIKEIGREEIDMITAFIKKPT